MNIQIPKRVVFLTLLLILIGFSVQWVSAQGDSPPAKTGEYYTIESELTANGLALEKISIHGPSTPPLAAHSMATNLVEIDQGATVQLTVPYSTWAFGCSATSAAMIAGYYDNNGFPNMYSGPTNGGVYPSTNATWGTWVDGSGDTVALNPLSYSKNGLDGRTSRGSVEDYWESEGTGQDGYHDPWYQNNWAEHTYEDAVGDFMYTGQWDHGYENIDGETQFWANAGDGKLTCDTLLELAETYGPQFAVDGNIGLRNFYESRGYTVSECYTQSPDFHYAGGFSFADYKAEIDAGYPVMVNLTGHTVVGTGYNDSVSPPIIYINDTWDHLTHSMNWGGTYYGMEMWSFNIVHPVAPPVLPPDNDDFDNAEVVTTPDNINLDTRGATQSYDDPDIEACNLNSGHATVWYKYSHTGATSAVALDTQTSDYDTFIAVWTGTRGDLALVTCNDDIDRNNENYQSQVAFQVTDGTTYYIEVGEWNGSYGASAASVGK